MPTKSPFHRLTFNHSRRNIFLADKKKYHRLHFSQRKKNVVGLIFGFVCYIIFSFSVITRGAFTMGQLWPVSFPYRSFEPCFGFPDPLFSLPNLVCYQVTFSSFMNLKLVWFIYQWLGIASFFLLSNRWNYWPSKASHFPSCSWLMRTNGTISMIVMFLRSVKVTSWLRDRLPMCYFIEESKVGQIQEMHKRLMHR